MCSENHTKCCGTSNINFKLILHLYNTWRINSFLMITQNEKFSISAWNIQGKTYEQDHLGHLNGIGNNVKEEMLELPP